MYQSVKLFIERSNLSLIVIILLSFILLSVSYLGFQSWQRGYADIHLYLDAAAIVLNGADPYSTVIHAKSFLYSPTFAVLISPLTFLNNPWLLSFWMSIHLLILVFIYKLIFEWFEFKQINQKRYFLAFSLLLVFLPIVADIQEGQVNLIVTLQIALGLRSYERRDNLITAICFASAALIKFQALIFIIPFLFAKRFKTSVYIICTYLGLLFLFPFILEVLKGNFISAFTHSLELNNSYFSNVLLKALSGSIAGREEFYLSNYSISAVFNRLFAQDVVLHPYLKLPQSTPLLFSINQEMLLAIVLVIKILLLGFALKLTYQVRNESTQLRMASILLYLVLQLASPTCWEHHLVSLILLSPILFLGTKEPRLKSFHFITIAFLMLCTSALYFVAWLGEILNTNLSQVLLTTRLYGLPLFALIALFLVQLLRVKRY
ncbi:MAG: DUF2029 domain-containing protein [Deltaproteobacteria bacterium]|nr:DUF2029 domain-containing protein [Deltaproteobacteria bacterium]